MRIRVAVAAALMAVLAACGGGSDGKGADDSGSTGAAAQPKSSATAEQKAAQSPTEELTAIAQQELDDSLGANPNVDAAYARLSQRCRGVLSKSDYAADLEFGRGMLQDAHTTFTVKVEGDKASVTYHYGGALDDATSAWVRENGSWYDDDCDQQ